jgi:hypothetical protein
MTSDMTLQDRFAVRYYRWALRDFYSEIAGGFPRIRKVTGLNAWHLLNFMDRLQPGEQQVLATGLVKRWNPLAVALTEEPPNVIELEAVEAFLGWARGEMMPQERETARQRAAGNWRPATRREIRSAVAAEMTPAIGSRQKGGSGEVTYVRKLAGVELYTTIDTGARTFALDYAHLIVSNGRRFWPEQISILSWLGVAGMTVWSDIRDVEVGCAVHSLREFCDFFIDALPSLLSDPANGES